MKELAVKVLNDHLWMGTEPTEAQKSILSAIDLHCEALKEENVRFKKAFADAVEDKLKLKEDNNRLKLALKAISSSNYLEDMNNDKLIELGYDMIFIAKQALNKEG